MGVQPLRPKPATLKRLFAVSGNRCAFPRCTQPLVHDSKLTGRVCHIRAASPGGPRFDARQTDEERRAFENLVLMCPIHADVIDADEASYTVERLASVKTEHEARHPSGPDPDDSIVRQLLVNLSGARVEDGSVIISRNQLGGQVAHTIHNYGPPKRAVSDGVRAIMLTTLRAVPPSRIGFASTQGDVEAHDFKEQLIDLFRDAGWPVQDMGTFMFFGSKKGIVLTIPPGTSEDGAPEVVGRALASMGSPVTGSRADFAKECGIYVQVWHAS